MESSKIIFSNKLLKETQSHINDTLKSTSTNYKPKLGILSSMFNKKDINKEIVVNKRKSTLYLETGAYESMRKKDIPLKAKIELIKAKEKNVNIENVKQTLKNRVVILPKVKDNNITKYDKFQDNSDLVYIDKNVKIENRLLDHYSKRINNFSINFNKEQENEIKLRVDKILKRDCSLDNFNNTKYGNNYKPFNRFCVNDLRLTINKLITKRDDVINRKRLIFMKEFPIIENEIDNLIIS